MAAQVMMTMLTSVGPDRDESACRTVNGFLRAIRYHYFDVPAHSSFELALVAFRKILQMKLSLLFDVVLPR